MATATAQRFSLQARSPVARGRRPGWLVLSLALIVGLGVISGWLYQQAGHKTQIVVMADRVPAGHVISRSDLTTVPVAGPLTSISGSYLSKIVGLRASVTLLAGMPVQRSMLSTSGDLEAGQAQVGLALTSGQVPADSIQPGDSVEILRVASSEGAPSGSGTGAASGADVLVPKAVVWSMRSDPSRSGGVLLTVLVPSQVVSDVVAASGAGQVAVARVLG